MRTRLSLAALGVTVAAAVLPLRAADAYCDPTWWRLTGDCNSCDTRNRLTGRTDPCPG